MKVSRFFVLFLLLYGFLSPHTKGNELSIHSVKCAAQLSSSHEALLFKSVGLGVSKPTIIAAQLPLAAAQDQSLIRSRISDVLIIIGALVVVAGGFMILAAAFQVSLWWVVGGVMCAPVQIIFVILHWAETKKAFGLQLVGVAMICLGSLSGAGSAGQFVLNLFLSSPANLIPKPSYAAYKKFADSILTEKFDEAYQLAGTDEVRSEIERFKQSDIARGRIHGATYLKKAEAESQDKKTITYQVIQVVKLDPPGVTSAFGTVDVPHEHRVTLTESDLGWKVIAFEDIVQKSTTPPEPIAATKQPRPSQSASTKATVAGGKGTNGAPQKSNAPKKPAKEPEYEDNVNEVDAEGWTPLLDAVSKGDPDIVNYLLKKSANPNLADRNGWSPLMYASFNGNIKLVKILLEKGANVQAKTNQSSTALIIAAANGHTEIVKTLLKSKADFSVKDSDGKTALHHANEKQYSDVVEVLKNAGAHE
jgi:uncharacterized protein